MGRDSGVLLFGFACAASSVIVNSLLVIELKPLNFVAIRLLVAGLLLTLYAYYRCTLRSLLRQQTHCPVNILSLVVRITLATAFPSLFKAYALTQASASYVSFVSSLDPFVAAIYMSLLWQASFSSSQWIGMIVGCAALLLFLSHHSPVGETQGGSLILALLALLVALFVGKYGWMCTQALLRLGGCGWVEVNGITMLLGGVVLMLYVGLFGEWIHPTTRQWAGLVYSTFSGNIVSYAVYAWFLSKHPVTLASLLGFSVPLFVYVYDWGASGSSFSLDFLLSLAMLAAGVFLYEWGRDPKKQWGSLYTSPCQGERVLRE